MAVADAALYWRLRLDSVCLIGEFTDASGPVGDDYCVTFVQRGSGVRYVLPYDSVGCGLVMDAISHARRRRIVDNFGESIPHERKAEFEALARGY